MKLPRQEIAATTASVAFDPSLNFDRPTSNALLTNLSYLSTFFSFGLTDDEIRTVI